MTAGKVQSDQERLFEVELLTVSQVAKWARVSPKSIYRWGSGLGISDNGSNIRETFLALPIFERECRIFSEKRDFLGFHVIRPIRAIRVKNYHFDLTTIIAGSNRGKSQ